MIEIVNAKYGDKNVKDIVSLNVKNNELYIEVNNKIFGDPNPGILKKLEVEYILDDVFFKIEANENSILKIPENKTNVLGIFYTNNNIDNNVLNESLNRIALMSKKCNVDILVSSWTNINNCPFPIINCSVRTGDHFNIAYQISSLLMRGLKMKDYKYVAFLEHDVLYGEDYLIFQDFDGNVLSNENFIGLNKNGFQKKIQYDQPLHQLIMKYDYAIEHFKNILMESIVSGVNLEAPHNIPYIQRLSSQPSIHVNHGRHFTSHFNIYSKENYQFDNYWGNSTSLIEKCNL